MQIRRIEVQNYRKLIGPVVIDNIGDGLTVIAGDNEEGKSTLLQALRSALFDRHSLSGSAADSMLPFGYKVRPEIKLEFEVEGTRYKLTKGFCSRPGAELVTPTGIVTDDHAEECLQELLRFKPPGRGRAKPNEHDGIFGMFWIEQGKASNPLSLNADNCTTMMGALESEVGQVLGGARGRKIRDAIDKKYQAFFTGAGKPRGEYADANADVSRLEDEIVPKRDLLKAYDGKVDELDRTRERLAAYDRDNRRATAEKSLADAQSDLDLIAKLEVSVKEAKRDLDLAEAGIRAPTDAVRQRDALTARETKDGEDASKRRIECQAADDLVTDLTAEFTSRSAARSEAEAALQRANAQLLAIDRQMERERLAEEEADLTTAVGAAREAEEKAREARAALSAIKVDAATLKQLRILDQKMVAAESALAGSSTVIRFALSAVDRVSIDGRAIAETEVSATDPTSIKIESVGTITVVPGGEELGAKRSAANTAQRQLHQALQKVGCTSLSEAETLEQERRNHEQAAKTHSEVSKAHAPQGLDALAESLAAISAALAKLPDVEQAGEISRDAALSIQRKADDAAKRARTEEESYQKQLNDAMQEQASKRALLKAANDKAAESADELKRAREVKADVDLRDELVAASGRETRAKASLEQAEEKLAAADPEAAQLRFEGARDGLAAIVKDLENLHRRASDLTLELQVIGQQGLGEELQELEGELVAAIHHRDRLQREADALKLLFETLSHAERQARETFLAPVQRRVQPYLRLLHPESEVVLSDDDLGVTALRRNGRDEPFDSLSVGAREQVAVLTRLAFADLLRERGTIAPIVLDDALVNTDPGRFKRMMLAIRKAAKNLQIIVLTCNEVQWLQEGAPTIRLSDCVTTSVA